MTVYRQALRWTEIQGGRIEGVEIDPVIMEEAQIAAGTLVRAITRNQSGEIIGCSVTFVPIPDPYAFR